MEARKSTIIASLAVVFNVCLIMILWYKIKKSKILFSLTALCVASIVSIFVWIVIRYTNLDYRRRLSMRRRTVLEGQELRQEYSFLRKVAGMPRRFKYEELVTATHDFSNLIGRGSSASVFKGELEDGTKVAVKRIEETSERGEREFRSEVCAIANTQHVNLVRLLGFCLSPNTESRFLVYEFVHNGSLNQWIFSKNGDTCTNGGRKAIGDNELEVMEEGGEVEKCLPWKSRYQVAIDVGKALAYLHHQCRQKVVHLDVKPENILLDEHFCAQVADFGLSKLMAKDQSRIMSRIRGTKGYLAPEWLIGRGVSEKSDVYSYGMVLMELVGGRRNTKFEGRNWTYFPKIVANKIVEGKVMEVVDRRLMDVANLRDGSVPSEKEVKALTYVGLWCVQEEPKLRPSMARVVDMLEGRLPIEKPPETDMVIVDLLGVGIRDDDLYPQPHPHPHSPQLQHPHPHSPQLQHPQPHSPLATAATTKRTSTISYFSSTSSTFLPPHLPLPRRQIPPIFVSIPIARRFLSLHISCCSRRKLIAYACIGRSDDEESGLPVNLDTSIASDSDKGVTFDTKLPRRRLMVEFTCNSCGERTKRIVNRLAYEKGTVFVQCAGCLSHHKLVDNLGLVAEYDLRTDDDLSA